MLLDNILTSLTGWRRKKFPSTFLIWKYHMNFFISPGSKCDFQVFWQKQSLPFLRLASLILAHCIYTKYPTQCGEVTLSDLHVTSFHHRMLLYICQGSSSVAVRYADFCSFTCIIGLKIGHTICYVFSITNCFHHRNLSIEMQYWLWLVVGLMSCAFKLKDHQ